MTDDLDLKMARIMARVAAELVCPACEAREERAAILEYDAGLPRRDAEQRAGEMHPCRHLGVA